MAITSKDPKAEHRIPVQTGTAVGAAQERVRGGRVVAVVRIAMGLLFLWPFLDKTFGLGYATPAGRGWVDGGSPTKGFLDTLDHGPLTTTLGSWAGRWWADWLFMLGLLGIAAALLLGVGVRVAAVSGTAMMALVWVAEWPPARATDTGAPTTSSNPVLDPHVVYALVLIALAVLAAGTTWGLGGRWQRLDLVRHNPWLR